MPWEGSIRRNGCPQTGAGTRAQGARLAIADRLKRRGGRLRQGVEVRFEAVEELRGVYPVRLMCRRLRMSSGGFYASRKRPKSHRSKDNRRLLSRIEELHEESDGVLGSRRIFDELRHEGETC